VKFVGIPTRDQDRALAFWTEKLGMKGRSSTAPWPAPTGRGPTRNWKRAGWNSRGNPKSSRGARSRRSRTRMGTCLCCQVG